jgi:hypothetical protein
MTSLRDASAVGICWTIARNKQTAATSLDIRDSRAGRRLPRPLKYGLEQLVVTAQPRQVLPQDEAGGERVLDGVLPLREAVPEIAGQVHDLRHAGEERVGAGHAYDGRAHGRREEALANVGVDRVVGRHRRLQPVYNQASQAGARGRVVLHQGLGREERGQEVDPIGDEHGAGERVLEAR